MLWRLAGDIPLPEAMVTTPLTPYGDTWDLGCKYLYKLTKCWHLAFGTTSEKSRKFNRPSMRGSYVRRRLLWRGQIRSTKVYTRLNKHNWPNDFLRPLMILLCHAKMKTSTNVRHLTIIISIHHNVYAVAVLKGSAFSNLTDWITRTPRLFPKRSV